jgi:hypothetical protein
LAADQDSCYYSSAEEEEEEKDYEFWVSPDNCSVCDLVHDAENNIS